MAPSNEVPLDDEGIIDASEVEVRIPATVTNPPSAWSLSRSSSTPTYFAVMMGSGLKYDIAQGFIALDESERSSKLQNPTSDWFPRSNLIKDWRLGTFRKKKRYSL
jgi:hypothetical protein